MSFGAGGVDWAGGRAPFWVVPLLMVLAYSLLAGFRSPWVGYTAILVLILLRPALPSLDPFAGFALALAYRSGFVRPDDPLPH